MEKIFPDLVRLGRLNISNCPINSKKSVEEVYANTFEEMVEVLHALNNNDPENLEEELGDVLWDLVNLILQAEKQKGIDSRKVIIGVIEKIKRRKPWLIRGEKVTAEEARRIWREAKAKEKQ